MGRTSSFFTELVWEKQSAPGTYTWQAALKYCENLELAGQTDWRLPNMRELQSIVDYGRFKPAIDPVFEASPNWYWSSSAFVGLSGYAGVVGFYNGGADDMDLGNEYFVRAVRNAP